MNWVSQNLFRFTADKKTTILLLSVVFFFMASAPEVSAQKRFSKTYPATKNVSLKLLNRDGTVTVEGWDRNEIRISADLEAPAANISPQSLSGTIYINLIKDNQGRNGVGSVNFNIKVPYTSVVDIETLIGNLSVSNIQSSFVRAHISSDGDITLTNISSNFVVAENGMGDIFFDGPIHSGGIYRFRSMKGNISLRIPFNASFKLVATAPTTRNISLGMLPSSGFRFVGEGRRVIGQSGDGSASLTVTNQRGSISFLGR